MIPDDELLAAFEAGREPEGGFHHREHLRVAWLYLRRDPWPVALGRFAEGLKGFAIAQGHPGLYHETVTVAYFLLIHQRMVERGQVLNCEFATPDLTPPEPTFDAFVAGHPELLGWKPSILDRYYEAATLASDLARRVFVMPDRLAK
jgi:hypothetical protein